MPELQRVGVPGLLLVPDGLVAARSLGYQLAHFIETLLCHGPGDVIGEPLEVDDEWRDFLVCAYALDDHGRRLVREALLSRLKGWAKSEKAGAIVCCEALGPARFSHWAARGETSWWGYAYEEGEPVGRAVTSPFIRCLATEEDQTANTYGNVLVMLSESRLAEEIAGLDVGVTRTILPYGGEIRPSTAGAASKDGGKETFAVADETHLYTLAELRQMYATVSRNLTKRKASEPWMLGTTTMFDPAQQSTARSLLELGEAIRDGKQPNRSGLLIDHREGPEPKDPDDDADLMRTVRVAAGSAASWMDLDAAVAERHKPETTWPDWLRYFANRRHQAQGAAFDVELWRKLARPAPAPPKGTLVTLGFDGARFHDATALIGTVVESGWQWPVGIWERPYDADDSWEIDADDVDAAVADAFATWDVWRLYADPPYWEDRVDVWAGRYGEKRVVKWWTNRVRPMAWALRAYSTAMNTAAVTHSGDPVLAQHIGNSRRRDESRVKDERGQRMWTICKERHDSPLKIDAAMAGCLSWTARGDAVAAGALNQRKRGGAAF